MHGLIIIFHAQEPLNPYKLVYRLFQEKRLKKAMEPI